MSEWVQEKSLSIEELSGLRQKTEAVSKLLEEQLRGYLETLRPLFGGRRLFGRHVGGKEDVTGSDRALNELREKYREVARIPYGLPPELPEDSLTELEFRPETYPWEYSHQAKTDQGSKLITITSPVRWILTYSSPLTLGQIRQTVAKKTERRPDVIRQFVVSALAMHLFFKAFPSLGRLLNDLRYEVSSEPIPGLGDVPFVTIRSCLPSFRPSDDLLLSATQFSGIAAFIELIDLDAARSVQDPLKARLQAILS